MSFGRAVSRVLGHPIVPPAFVYLAALSLRLSLAITARELPFFQIPIMDMEYHDRWARAIAAGELWGTDVFFRAPLYPYFLGLLYWISGNSVFFARIVQAVIGSFSPVLLYFLGLALFESKRLAFLAALLLATLWTAVYFDVELLLVVLEILLDVSLLLFLARARGGRLGDFILAGLVTGLSAITRPNILAFAVLVWIAFVIGRPRLDRRALLRGLAAYYACALVVIAPVTVRNYLVGEDFVLIASQAGVNLHIGNNAESDGVSAVAPGHRRSWWGGFQDAITEAESAEGRTLKPSEVSRYYVKKVWAFFTGSPREAVRIMARKAYYYTLAYEFGNNFDNNYLKRELPVLRFDPVSLYIVLPFAFLGMGVCIWRFREHALLLLFTVVYSGTVILFFVNDKFRMPVVPAFCLFASAGLFWLLNKARTRSWRHVFVSILALVGLFVHTGRISAERNLAEAYGAISTIYLQLGRYREAEAEIRKFLRQHPDDPRGSMVLAEVYLHSNRRAEAIRTYRAILEQDPDNHLAWNYLGAGHAMEGDLQEAYRCFERSLQINSSDASTYYHLAQALARDGRVEEARDRLRQAVSLRERSQATLAALAMLGRLSMAAGDPEEARRAYSELLRLDPENAQARAGMEAAGR